ncbi:MAG: Gfo/Idh/MocA family oxidoreductase [Clostridia bacterium]|nr:Gfo/Idh/MocA family oxidoreductase [Clostridia bacterium]MBR4013613.1 Gfo/Idh/MocA family oxidoreductase [Clostridia bacterium]
MEKIRMGVIGLGQRGYYNLNHYLAKYKDVEIRIVCDVYDDRLERAAADVKEQQGIEPICTKNYKEVLNKELVDAVYIATSWETHIEISIASLRAGIITATEVGGAYTVEECYELVKAYEETGTPFMLMENCCFNDQELLATAAARAGKLGTIVHCSGAYAHDLRKEVSEGNIKRHYRLRNYLNRNAENYPTHELGPIARLLNINRGNRMVSLVSIASKSCGLEEYIEENKVYEQDPTLKNAKFKQGDIVNTIITCAGGETILLTLDTTLPRSYNRDIKVRGTKGLYEMATNSFFFDGMKEQWRTVQYYTGCMDNAKEYYGELLPDVWKNMTEEDKKSGHGGMDGVMFRIFVEAVKSGSPMPIDVYDAASWMCVTALSEASIAQGGAIQQIPDFTAGKWLTRQPEDVIKLN